MNLLKSLVRGLVTVCAVVVGGVSAATFDTSVECDAAKLAHRWSFNGSKVDSVGGRSAEFVGWASWNDTDNPTAAKTHGSSNGRGYINLGYDLFPRTGDAVTIEIWARQDGVWSWSRLFDIGLDTSNYFLLSWSNGTDINNNAFECVINGSNGNGFNVRPAITPFTLGTMFHVSLILQQRADGKVDAKLAKRDVTTGAVIATASATTAKTWSIGSLSNWRFYLGHSQYSSDNDAAATYDEVRVWHTALTDAQLTWSALLGADNLPTVAAETQRVTRAFTSSGTGAVRVNDGVACTATNVTAGANEVLTVTAVPGEGQTFRRWEGATGDILTGATTDATITLRTAGTGALKAVFIGTGSAVRSVWTGAGDGTSPSDPANWSSVDLAGAKVVAAPSEGTTVVLQGNSCGFSCPAGTAFTYASLVVSNVTLVANADWRGLGAYAVEGTVDLAGHNLYTGPFTGSGRFTSPVPVDTTVAAPAIVAASANFWLDASDDSTMEIDATGKVTKWTSKDANHVVASASGTASTNGRVKWGFPTLDMGTVGCGADMRYTRFTNLRTVFWVIRIDKSMCAFLLGDCCNGNGAYNFHRGSNAEYGGSAWAKYDVVWNGLTPVTWRSDVIPDDQLLVLSATTTQNCCSDALSQDRNISGRNAGRQLSELICFPSVLGDSDRTAIVQYLQQKWQAGFATAPAELHISVPEGESATNSGVQLCGHIQLVKDGAGTFVAARATQTNWDGVKVATGTLKAGVAGGSTPLGLASAPIAVESGATFDVAGYSGFSSYPITLAGGTLTNSGAGLVDSDAQLGAVTLTADSSVAVGAGIGIRSKSLDLGGHVLSVDSTRANAYFLFQNELGHDNAQTVMKNGTIRFTGDYALKAWASFDASTVDFDIAGCVYTHWTTTVHNLVFRTPRNEAIGTVNRSIYRVTGTYTPVSRYTLPIELTDGATLDLTSATLPFVTASELTYNALGGDTTFAKDATVTVDVNGLSLTAGQCIISWTTKPTNVTFQWDATTRATDGVLEPTVGENGLYYGAAATTVAVAHWTGAAGDGDWANAANWTCSNAFDAVIADGIPGAGTHVHLAGDAIACTVPANAQCGSFEIGTGSLAGDCDLRGLTCTPTFTGTLDLKGHNLYVNNNLVGATGKITDSTGYETLEYIESTGYQAVNTGIYADTSVGVEADFETLGYVENATLFGTTTWSSCRYLFIEQGNYLRFYGAGENFASFTANKHYRLTITPSETSEALATGTLFDGETNELLATQSFNTTNLDTNASLYLFNISGQGKCGNLRLRSFKMTKNGETVRDFIPVRVVGTGMVGLLDQVTQTFYPNVGAKYQPFVAGPVKTTSAAGGELHLVIPQGQICHHQYVTLDGTLKLVIDGAGTYVADLKQQCYYGGTDVADATVQLLYSGNATTHAGTNLQLGGRHAPVTVGPNATIDLNGNYDSSYVLLYLNGGHFVNNAYDQTNTGWGVGHSTDLLADSTFDIGSITSFWGANVAHNNGFRLNGHTLTINIAANKSLQLRKNTWASNGVFRVVGAGRVIVWDGATDSRTADFDMNGVGLQLDAALSVRDYIVRAPSAMGQWGVNPLYVYGRFAPYSDKFYSPTLLDGATLDLSMKTGTWSVYTDEFSVPAQTTFASGATIKVELGARTPTVGEKLVAWDARPAGVTFAWTDSCAANLAESPVAMNDGLYYGGDEGEVTVAHWTGAAGDGDLANAGNWVCSNAFDRVVANGVPGAQATVWIEGSNVNCQFPRGGVPSYYAITVADCTLTADCDWRGLDVAFTGTIDLAGHKLYVSKLNGSGTVKSVLVPQASAVAEPAKLASASLWLDASRPDTMTMDVNNNVTQWRSRAGSLVANRENACPVYNPTVYGRPTLDFGGCASTRDMAYTRQDFRTVFWVVKIAKDERAFLLGDTTYYNYHRGSAGQYSNTAHGKFTSIWNGTTVVSNIGSTYIPDDDFQVISATMSSGLSDRLTRDRTCSGRHGGRQLSELIGFTSTLTTAERTEIVQYLQAKWNALASVPYAPGELHIDVPAGETVLNTGVSIAGEVRLVKDGAGTFVPQRSSQTYFAGTEATAGTIRADRNGTTYHLGPGAANVQLDRGASFDLAGYNEYTVVKFILNGGEITNSGMDRDDTTAFGKVVLTADSSFRLPHNVSVWWDAHYWDLGGHTLTVSNAPAAKLHLAGNTTTYANGTLRIEDGWLRIWHGAVSAKTIDIYQNGRFDIPYQLDIRDYTAAYAGNEGACTAQLNVWGRFTPLTDYFYGCTLQNGATLDLTHRTGTWNATRTGSDGQPKTVSFADNATITVDINGQIPGGQRQIVNWKDNAPSNLAGLKFQFDATSRKKGYRMVVNSDGIFVNTGLIVLLR